MIRQEKTDQIDPGEDNGGRGNRQTPVKFGAAVFFLLPFCFQHIEESQTDQRAKGIKKDNGDSPGGIQPGAIQKNCREHTKADPITKGVDLNTEIFFVSGAVLFRSGHQTVEYIAKTGKSKKNDSKTQFSLYGKHNSQNTGNQAKICQNNSVIVKADEFQNS